MNTIDTYVKAATRDNTRRSYQSAIEHFEVTWGGLLPATPNTIAQYLVNYADSLAMNTLKQRLSAIAQWHQEQGFPDPTKAPMVRKVLKGIRELHPMKETQARPVQIEQLQQIVDYLDLKIQEATDLQDTTLRFQYLRNKSFVLMGFWRGFRSDELRRLKIEDIKVSPGEGMTLFLPRTKTDKQQLGSTYRVPSLSKLCPVDAYLDWITAANLKNGPVFRRIDRWGNIGSSSLHANSVIPLLRKLISDAGIADAHQFSAHSLRRGFATWAGANNWDVKSLMEYVGWKDMKSALRYIDVTDSFNQRRIESSL